LYLVFCSDDLPSFIPFLLRSIFLIAQKNMN